MYGGAHVGLLPPDRSVPGNPLRSAVSRCAGGLMTRLRPRTASAAVLFFVAPMLATVVGAQVVGAILSGTVADPTGAPVASATVAVRNVETGVLTITHTNTAGMYSIPNLLPGDYVISAEAFGLMSRKLP